MATEPNIEEGETYQLRVDAKDARGEGIGKVGDLVVFVQNAKTRIGNIYNIKITKMHRTFAFAELCNSKRRFVGNGSALAF